MAEPKTEAERKLTVASKKMNTVRQQAGGIPEGMRAFGIEDAVEILDEFQGLAAKMIADGVSDYYERPIQFVQATNATMFMLGVAYGQLFGLGDILESVAALEKALDDEFGSTDDVIDGARDLVEQLRDLTSPEDRPTKGEQTSAPR